MEATNVRTVTKIVEHYERHGMLYGVMRRLCEAPDCNRLHYARGYCETHYRRLIKDGLIATGRRHWIDRYPTHPAHDYPVGVVPMDAGRPAPYSARLRQTLVDLEARDAARDARDAGVYAWDGTRWTW
jgi:hypothetical protein